MLKRGTREIIADSDTALLVRDSVSDAYFLACEDQAAGLSLLDRYVGPECDLLMVSIWTGTEKKESEYKDFFG